MYSYIYIYISLYIYIYLKFVYKHSVLLQCIVRQEKVHAVNLVLARFWFSLPMVCWHWRRGGRGTAELNRFSARTWPRLGSCISNWP